LTCHIFKFVKKLEQMTPSQVPLSSRTVSPAFIPSQSFQQQAHIPERSPIVPSARDVTQRMGVDILPNTSKQMEPTQDITAFTQELIRMYQLPVQTQDQLRRFYNLIVSRMKGIRDEQELHDMLISPWNLGGMDFTTGLVQQVQSSIQKQAAFLQQMTDEQSETYEKNGQEKIVFAHGDAASVNIRTEQPTKIARPVFEKPIHDIPAPQVATPTTTLEEQRGQDARQAQTTSIYTNPLQQGWQYTTKVEYKKDAPSRTPVILPTESKEIESQSKPQVVSAPVPQEVVKPKPLEATTIPKIMPAQKIFPTVRKSLLPDSKPKLSDIRMRPTPMGPLEELQSFSVKDLRQLSQDPKQVTQLLQGKLDLLEEESLEAKSKGINAWKRSVLNQLYIEMGQESLVSGESIENIMQKRAEQKRPYLTVEEFEAIADFNTSLRF